MGHGMCELKARHGRGTEWARHAMCELAFTVEWEPLSMAGRYWANGRRKTNYYRTSHSKC